MASMNDDSEGKMNIKTHDKPLPEGETYPWEIDMSGVVCNRLIGSGAFGSVYGGTFKGQEVAVKFLNLPEGVTASHMEHVQSTFRQEVAVWQTLNHPNIVQFMGASLKVAKVKGPPEGVLARQGAQPLWAIVTEFLDGGTLKSFLVKRNYTRMSLDQTTSMALDIARGLGYLHSKNIVHRDIKSDNLLLNRNKPFPNVKIADFGVARVEAHNPEDMTINTGTVRWMAPEILDRRPYSRKVDVYSFGIVLWELFTCQHPYKGLNYVKLATEVVNKGLRPEHPERCPELLVKLMQDCWQANPDVRPEFTEVIERLEAMRSGPESILNWKPVAEDGGGCLCQ